MKLNISFILVVFFTLTGCDWGNDPKPENVPNQNEIPTIGYTVNKALPHDTNSFTEGLFIHDGKFFESTGGAQEFVQTKSLFGILDTATGRINTKVELDKNKYFGEGIALLNGKIYQLTYKSRIGFVYDAKTYKQLDQFSIPTEQGWGITTNGSELIMSDGSNKLFFLNPDNLQLVNQVSVSENGYAVDRLNELEYIEGNIYANIFTTNTIIKIDPQSGAVIGKMDLTSLFMRALSKYPRAVEMNGIAYDPSSKKLYVTGKFWPTLYEIELLNL